MKTSAQARINQAQADPAVRTREDITDRRSGALQLVALQEVMNRSPAALKMQARASQMRTAATYPASSSMPAQLTPDDAGEYIFKNKDGFYDLGDLDTTLFEGCVDPVSGEKKASSRALTRSPAVVSPVSPTPPSC